MPDNVITPTPSKRTPWHRWDWNANSGDTGGIVMSDWVTIDFEKTDYLRSYGLKPLYATIAGGDAAMRCSAGAAVLAWRCSACIALHDQDAMNLCSKLLSSSTSAVVPGVAVATRQQQPL
jgi:hypothetical protein